MNWSDGYISGIDYTYGYFPELNPLQAKLKLLFAGIKPPEFKTACELGFGQGVSILAHAAGTDIDWYGNDFNPSHVAFASDLAKSSDLNLNISDDSFDEFCTRSDLPQFDFIGLHGVWSWISSDNRLKILEFIKKRLKVGGLVYVSYNTSPGRNSMVPIRDLLFSYNNSLSSLSDEKENIEYSVDFLSRFFDTNPKFASNNPSAVDYFKRIKSKEVEYLAHEYMNADWNPMSFMEINSLLSSAKLTYATSANGSDAFPHIHLTSEQTELLNDVKDRALKEVLIDFCLNREFRRDFWIKGKVPISKVERNELLGQIEITLAKPFTAEDYTLETGLGKASLSKEIYEPIVNILYEKGSITLSKLHEKLSGKISIPQLIEAALILESKYCIGLVQDSEKMKMRVNKTKNLNANIIKRSSYQSEIGMLVSPVSGIGIGVSRFEQLFIQALDINSTKAEDLANFAWNRVNWQNERLIIDGKVLETEEENIQELCSQAEIFLNEKLPLLKKLKVVF